MQNEKELSQDEIKQYKQLLKHSDSLYDEMEKNYVKKLEDYKNQKLELDNQAILKDKKNSLLKQMYDLGLNFIDDDLKNYYVDKLANGQINDNTMRDFYAYKSQIFEKKNYIDKNILADGKKNIADVNVNDMNDREFEKFSKDYWNIKRKL